MKNCQDIYVEMKFDDCGKIIQNEIINKFFLLKI